MLPQPKTIRIPVLANIYAGTPVPDDWQDWQIKKFRDIRRIENITPFERVAALEVIGNSLNNIGIFHGDLLVFKICHEYTTGKIGIWQTPHGRTAKFARENFDGTVTLHNENGWMQTWQPEDVQLIGIVVRVERDL